MDGRSGQPQLREHDFQSTGFDIACSIRQTENLGLGSLHIAPWSAAGVGGSRDHSDFFCFRTCRPDGLFIGLRFGLFQTHAAAAPGARHVLADQFDAGAVECLHHLGETFDHAADIAVACLHALNRRKRHVC